MSQYSRSFIFDNEVHKLTDIETADNFITYYLLYEDSYTSKQVDIAMCMTFIYCNIYDAKDRYMLNQYIKEYYE